MAKRTEFVSDISGEPIVELAIVRVLVGERVFVLEANFAEVAELAAKGKEQKKRGRKAA